MTVDRLAMHVKATYVDELSNMSGFTCATSYLDQQYLSESIRHRQQYRR